MTAPAFQTPGAQFQANATNIDLVVPAATQPGDLLIAVVGARESGAITSPAGWTEQDNTYNSTGVCHLVVCTRVAQAGDAGATFTWTNTAAKQSAGLILRVTGQDPTTPVNAFAAGNQGSGTNITNVGTTTTAADCLLIHGVIYQVGTATITPDAAVSEDADFGGGTTTSAHVWVGHETQAVAGAVASRANTASSNVATRKFILAIAPAVATSPPMPRRGSRQIPLLVR